MPQNKSEVVSNEIYLQKAKSVLISQAEFARHIGKSRQYVHKLIHSGKLPASGKRIDFIQGLVAIAAQRSAAYNLRRSAPHRDPAQEPRPDNR